MNHKTECPTNSSPSPLDNVLEFIRDASPQELQTIVHAVRVARKRHGTSQQFKPGDKVEWTIHKGHGLGECFEGEIMKPNITTCTVAVRTNGNPLDYQLYRVPFELLRPVR